MTLSVVIITCNEEANLVRTLESVQPLIGEGKGEIIVVDSGSTDHTVEIAKSFGAKVFVEEWKGYAAQKNSAIDKATGDYVLSLDADEELAPDLAAEIQSIMEEPPREHKFRQKLPDGTSAPIFVNGFRIPRQNYFLGRWIRHGGFYPDPKLRLARRGAGRFEEYGAHPTMKVDGPTGRLSHAMLHHAYPTLRSYIDHEQLFFDGRRDCHRQASSRLQLC